jgi:hypothetical protein
MPNHSVSRLDRLDLVEVIPPYVSAEWKEFCFSFQLWQCMWADLCPTNALVSGELRRIYTSCVGDAVRVQALNTSLTSIYQSIVRDEKFPVMGRGYTKALKICLTEVMHSLGCGTLVECLDQVGSLLTWFKRLPVFLPSSDEEWLDYKKQAEHQCGPIPRSTTDALRSIALHWFSSFVWNSHSEARHGPGCTADAGKVMGDKQYLITISRWRAQLLRTTDGESFWTGGDVFDIPSKFQSVPKQLGKNRFICMEPAAIQYVQQGLFRSLYHFTRSSPLKGYFCLEDQEKNRSLCSLAHEYDLATIDLSNASDDVRYGVWKEIFQGTPLWRYIIGCRSKSLEYNGDEIHPTYVAPMGSAVCFIFETICFCLIVELAFRTVRRQKCRGYTDHVSVYGDDIICPADVAVEVVSLLTQLGFSVNHQKTFLDGPYKESCGVEYYKGQPIRRFNHPRHGLSPRSVTFAKVSSVMDLANTLESFLFFTARRHLLKTWSGVKVSGSHTFSDCVVWGRCSIAPDNTLKRKWSEDWQEYVVVLPTIVERYSPHDNDYELRLMSFPVMTRHERQKFHNGYHSIPREIKDAIAALVRPESFVGTGPHQSQLLHIPHPIWAEGYE